MRRAPRASASGRPIWEINRLRRPSSKTLSTMNMTIWRGLAAAVDDTTIALDPSSLKKNLGTLPVNQYTDGKLHSLWREASRVSQPIIVWMMAGSERKMTRRTMRRWSEPREVVITSVAHPVKTGRRRSSACRPSAFVGQEAGQSCRISFLLPVSM
jgi:hypothetical protein